MSGLDGKVKLETSSGTYWMRCSINAICDMETALGKNIDDILNGFTEGKIAVRDIRTMFWAMLQDHHPDIDYRKAGDIMTEIGFEKLQNCMTQALEAAFPAVEQGDDSKKNQTTGG